ncbi:Paraquat-inducible protein B [Shewanella morhuae]|uniref:PqiB family protein n=1 Tax=Shewanella morhuae TaxID=365591 RepID=UPI000956B97B|nr:MlaD family protein [Shewanella morhuae]SIR09312.1 Paraquat-inducible protein B [Shewanella morhuae]
MTQIESPKVVKKKLFSPIWLLPIVALALGAWLGIKSIKESGIEIQIHFPSATGIDVGKTLVKYQGLTVGKVKDIGIDEDLKGVNVKVMMDYRAKPFLNKETLFWLVTPKASITGVEGLDALFSGNYIAIQPGKGSDATFFEAERQPPPMLIGSEGVMVELSSDKLGSLDVGSPIFFRQIPVGSVASYRLDGNQRVLISVFIQEQYARLVKKNSHFWNVSGVKIDASLTGIQVNSESLASILAGGVSFSSDDAAPIAQNGDTFTLFDSETTALGGIEVNLTMADGSGVNKGTRIVYRGINIGSVLNKQLSHDGITAVAKFEPQYGSLLTNDGVFWLEGADISLSGIKNPERLLTGSVINFLPGIKAQTAMPTSFILQSKAPDLLQSKKRLLTLTSSENMGIAPSAEVRYKQIPIGKVLSVKLTKDLSAVEYQLELQPEFASLLRSDSYFVPESALTVNASLDGISVKTRDFTTFTQGAISLFQGHGDTPLTANSNLTLFSSVDAATDFYDRQQQTHVTLVSQDGADVSQGSPIYYKKMQIGLVESVNWQSKTEDFAIKLAIDKQFQSLLKKPNVFWRNSAMDISASLAGIDVAVAPLQGALKGSISLGLLDDSDKTSSAAHLKLYESKQLALAQAQAIRLTLPASSKLAAKAAIRYQGHQVGEVSQVKLNADLNTLTATAYLYGEYAEHFSRSDCEYHLVDAQISLAGIKAPATLITGPYIGVLPGKSNQKSTQFVANLTASSYANVVEDALKFTLEDKNLGSMKIGTPIFFRGIKVGQIDGYSLSTQGNSVLMQAHIEPQYKHLVNQSSQFWDASGIKVDVGLFSGAQIEAGSLETLLAGGINVATKDTTQANNRLAAGAILTLQHKAETEWQDWTPSQ